MFRGGHVGKLGVGIYRYVLGIQLGIGAFPFLNSPWRDLIVSLFNKPENCLKLIFGWNVTVRLTDGKAR